MPPRINKKYQALRRVLAERGTNLRRFAIERGYSIPTVYSAAKGHRYGRVSAPIIKELESYAAE